MSGTDKSGSTDQIQWDLSARLVRQVMKLAVKYYLHFSDDHIESLPIPRTDKKYLLYIHIPFCVSLCPYCSFHRFQLCEETARKYFELLRKEMRMTAEKGYNFDSVYFGGGTTTILPDELAKTIDLAHELFDITEVSCETDPNHINAGNLEYTEGRIDRVSVGIQTFNNRHLEELGRMAKFGTAEEQYERTAEIIKHFKVVNIDLIYNLPSQTPEDMLSDIMTARKLAPHQITFYPLMYAPIAGEKLRRMLGKSGYDKEAAYYKMIADNMNAPYIRKSSWTFALDNSAFIDEYVIGNTEYVGLGSGAFSFIGDKLYANSFSLQTYADRISRGLPSAVKSVRFGGYAISQYRMMVEMFGLNGSPVNRPFLEYNALRMMGAVSGGRITPKGMFLLSVMMKCFYNGMDYIRESMRSGLTPDDERIV